MLKKHLGLELGSRIAGLKTCTRRKDRADESAIEARGSRAAVLFALAPILADQSAQTSRRIVKNPIEIAVYFCSTCEFIDGSYATIKESQRAIRSRLRSPYDHVIPMDESIEKAMQGSVGTDYLIS